MPRVGADFGGYRIERVLGRGAMGIVYAATDRSLKREVAIKVLARQPGADTLFGERFRREAAIQANLDHPHIVPVHAFGEVRGELYLVMQLIRGDPLSRLLDSGALAHAESLNLLAQVADALDTAHASGLVHRDVKPENILVSDRGCAFLADFGLTRDLTSDARLTRSGTFMGTANYVSPEQAAGRPATAAADIYSLAAVLFECVTGCVPYVRDSAVAVLHAHIRDPVPSAQELDATLPRELDEVIRAGLAKDAFDRPGTAVELIELARSALPVSQAVPSRPRPPAVGIGKPSAAGRVRARRPAARTTMSRIIPAVKRGPTGPRAEPANGSRWRRAVAPAVVVAVLAAAVSALTLGGEPDETSTTKGGTLTIATLDRASFGQYLDRIDASRSEHPRTRLTRAGALIGMTITVKGYRAKRLPLRWRIIDARTGDLVQRSQVDVYYVPSARDDQNSWPIWIPLPRGQDRQFFAEVELFDEGGRTPLAQDRTHRFKGV